uniref:Uncharacterized protein n=1 Tax=Parascaris univalens TaxID=6257 RepID=A0A915A3G0_PARUN
MTGGTMSTGIYLHRPLVPRELISRMRTKGAVFLNLVDFTRLINRKLLRADGTIIAFKEIKLHSQEGLIFTAIGEGTLQKPFTAIREGMLQKAFTVVREVDFSSDLSHDLECLYQRAE